MENNNLYVNAIELIELLECMELAADNALVAETLQEVINMIHDMNWREINE